MTNDHQSNREELLQGFAAGDLSRAEVLERAPELAGELDDWARLIGLMNRAAGDEREVLAAARDGVGEFDAGIERAGEFAARVASGGLSRGPIPLAAAAAILGAAGWAAIALWNHGPDPTLQRGPQSSPHSSPQSGHTQDQVLGQERVALEVLPEGSSGFVVRALVPPKELPNVRIVVYSGGGPDGAPIGKSPRLQFEASGAPEVRWTPAPQACEHWPDTIYWEVLSIEPRELLGSSSSRWP